MSHTPPKKLDELFRRAEQVIREKWVSKDPKIQDDLTALSVAHLSNYLPEVLPEMRPHLAKIVSAILDLEIEWEKQDDKLKG